MRRTNIYLADAQLDALRRLARQRGTSVAALVRDVLGRWLEEQGVRPIDADEWERRFDDLLTRRTRVAATRALDEATVERDVRDAIAEARAARRR